MPKQARQLVWIETPKFMGWGCSRCPWKEVIAKSETSRKAPSPETRDAFEHHRCQVFVAQSNKHKDVRWNVEIQEWFCAKCGRTSDHTMKEDAFVEMDQFDCELPSKPSSPQSRSSRNR